MYFKPTANAQIIPASRPSTTAAQGATNAQAGVIATSPATAPDAAPSEVACPSRIFSISNQPINAAPVATGVAVALAAQGKSDIRVIAQGGDGGTVDIGFGPLSGMFERNDDVLYVCYDNEAYMNTGVQRSGATPPAARTNTSHAVGENPGASFTQGKNLPKIAMAHGIPYVATASVADLHDLEAKVKKAMSFHGARYLHVLVPCPLGWGTRSEETIELARLATESGLFPIYEAERGHVTDVKKIRRRVPVDDYLKSQKRYAHLFGAKGRNDLLVSIQAIADRNIEEYGLVENE